MSPFDAPRHECDQALEAGAYLLKALAADERSAYAEHLQSCQECRHEVEQLRSVVDTLPIAAPQLAPPPELKERIMRIVDSEAELLRASGPEADRVRTPQKAEGRTRRWASGLFLRPAVAGGLASILIAVGVAGGVLLSGGDSTPSTRNVTAQVAAAGATATVSVQDGRAALHVTNLPAAPFGKVYQVWIKRKGVAAPIPTHTLFNVRKSDGSAVVPIEESVKDVEQVMVTDEPDGGSTQPTGTQLISATLS